MCVRERERENLCAFVCVCVCACVEMMRTCTQNSLSYTHTLNTYTHTFILGLSVDLSNSDIHLSAVLLKSFFRDLPEPLFPFLSFPQILSLDALKGQEKRDKAIELCNALPPQNKKILKYLFEFLHEVSTFSHENKMNASNLGVVFGPNLVWSRDVPNLADMGKINGFIAFLIAKYEEIFPFVQ